MQEENKKDASIYSDFAYDDAFRTMETECDDILIPFVNHFYNEHYDKTAKITRLRNEHFIEHEDQSDEKRITDSHFRITQGEISKIYHFECESKPYDNSILVRLFEYGSQIATDESSNDGTVLKVRFPYTGLLLLRRSNKAQDTAKVIIETPGRDVSYDIAIKKMSNYTIDQLFDNRLYFMIPFYIFNFERDFNKINRDEDKTEALAEIFRSLLKRLDYELETGNLSVFSYDVIIRLTHKVVYKLTMNHAKVQEKVGDIMGGKVLDLPEIRLFHEAKNLGLAEGEEERKKLADENEKLSDENEKLSDEKEKLANKNEKLSNEIELLRKELERLKNSNNS